MSRPRPLFVVGSPRSGTTWVQLLLHQSPAVATSPETQIFAYYLDHFRKQWIVEHTGPGAKYQGGAGLHRLLSEQEFEELCRSVAWFVLDRIHAERPDASIVVEKSPRHATLMEWILRILPEAWVLHVLRDPRDTCVSIMKAGRSWGRDWAPVNPIEAARLWRAHVVGARAADGLAERFLEVQYEALRKEPDRELGRILDWLELPHDAGFRRRALEACGLERLKTGDASNMPVPGGESPSGFFGSGSVGGWEGELGRAGVGAIEAICGDIMVESGYETATGGRVGPRMRIGMHDGIQRVRESIDWQIARFLRWF